MAEKHNGGTQGGLVVVDKPAGFTSHDIVAKARGMARTRRVGHAGTLDPMATGVLVLGIERATKLLGHLALAEKEYLATLRLGQSTLTEDAEGELLTSTGAQGLDPAAVHAALARWTGEVLQVPSRVSAVKVDGQRAYARVRKGEEVELAARPVTVSAFELLSSYEEKAADGTPVVDLVVRVECSSGTYVRALARDLGEELGTGGHLTALRRTQVGPYGLEAAHTLEQLQQEVDAERPLPVLPVGEAVGVAFARWDVDAEQARLLGNGAQLRMPAEFDGAPAAVFGPDGTFIALVERQRGRAKSLAVFV